MLRSNWQQLSLLERIRRLRYVLPPVLVLVVVLYQLGVAQTVERRYGHLVHYSVEISFYSLTGPVVTWLTLIWVERNLMEKERLQRQVQTRTQQLASLTEASADAILSTGSQGRITSWNRGAERMLGYRAEAILGGRLSRLLPDEKGLATRLKETGEVQNFETTARTADGRILTVNVTQTTQDERNGDLPATLIIMRDVTVQRERAAILEEERARIARDLHDGVAQTLYFLALQADMARGQVATEPEAVATTLEEIGKKTRHVIRDVRRTIFALRPLDWGAGDFPRALQHFIADFAEQMGWQAKTEIATDLVVAPRLQPTVFRLVQESLNNIAKHATADRVRVTLGADNGRLNLTVRDNGRGFEPTDADDGGLGLAQMERRAKAAGGAFYVSGQPGEGTTVTAAFPLKEGRDG